jgi:hypothetical protein
VVSVGSELRATHRTDVLVIEPGNEKEFVVANIGLGLLSLSVRLGMESREAWSWLPGTWCVRTCVEWPGRVTIPVG